MQRLFLDKHCSVCKGNFINIVIIILTNFPLHIFANPNSVYTLFFINFVSTNSSNKALLNQNLAVILN